MWSCYYLPIGICKYQFSKSNEDVIIMDTFYWGKRGSGKTLRASIDVLFDWYEGYEVWSNTWLHPAFDTNFITKQTGNYHYVDAVDLIKLLLEDKIPENNTPKVLLLDEIKTQANARNFSSFINKHLADFVSQARKRRFKLIYTDQILGAYDRWIRLMTDKIVRCVPIKDYRDLGLGDMDYPEPIAFEYIEIDLSEDTLESQEPNIYQIQRKTARNFYGLFKTEKIITPVELKYAEAIPNEEAKWGVISMV